MVVDAACFSHELRHSSSSFRLIDKRCAKEASFMRAGEPSLHVLGLGYLIPPTERFHERLTSELIESLSIALGMLCEVLYVGLTLW